MTLHLTSFASSILNSVLTTLDRVFYFPPDNTTDTKQNPKGTVQLQKIIISRDFDGKRTVVAVRHITVLFGAAITVCMILGDLSKLRGLIVAE